MGTFSIKAKDIREDPLQFIDVFKDLVVLQTEYKMYGDIVIYFALSYYFDEIEFGTIPPEYKWNAETKTWAKE